MESNSLESAGILVVAFENERSRTLEIAGLPEIPNKQWPRSDIDSRQLNPQSY